MNSSVNVHMQKEKEPDALSGPSHLDSATGKIMCFIEASATFFSQGSSVPTTKMNVTKLTMIYFQVTLYVFLGEIAIFSRL